MPNPERVRAAVPCNDHPPPPLCLASTPVVHAEPLRRSALPGLCLLILLLCAWLSPAAVWAAEAPAQVPPASAVQVRMMTLAADLRCLVCQNQNLADSHAELAVDLRRQILEQMQQGRSDQQIRDYLVARYGDFVLYNPPLKRSTALLWFGPALLVLLGLWAVRRSLRDSAAAATAPPMPAEALQRAEQLLRPEEGA